MITSQVIQTKVKVPKPNDRTLVRPRVSSLLAEALNYRLTILQAGAGYGKSTELAVFSTKHQPLIWYQVSNEDGDPQIFLLHLFRATQVALPEIRDLPFQMLETWDLTSGVQFYLGLVDRYINALSNGLDKPTLLVIDDAHRILQVAEIAQILDRLVAFSPPELHIVLTTRSNITLPSLSQWRSRGEVLMLDQTVLAFTIPEIMSLFSQIFGYELTADEAETLSVRTEGWAIALHLIWQNLRVGLSSSIENALSQHAPSLDSLFEILAQEVLQQHSDDIQKFMLASATLQIMTPEACDSLLGTTNSDEMLAYLRRQELFVVDLEDGSLRYHHIFHSFLRQLANPGQRRRWHQRAGVFYQERNDLDAAIYHKLKADDFVGAANLLDIHGRRLLAMGRLRTLSRHLDVLPPETLHQHPPLLTYLGDLARLHSRFQEALGWYQQAEAIWRERGQQDGVARALRGQARIYLDTVNPKRAEELLQQALRLSDGTADREAQARLYELLAENKLNAGKPDEADQLRQQAESLRLEGPSDSQLLTRVLLRTGRLKEAQKELEALAEFERQEPINVPRSHRETLFLLSLIYAFQGQSISAFQTALEGTRRGVELNSPFMTAVGYMRQGHALMLLDGADRYVEAQKQFEDAIAISQTLAIPKLKVEACWGLCRALGYQGDLTRAMGVAEDGLQIANQAGDEWIASLIRLALGASFCLAARYESAANWLEQAARGFYDCSDPFGYTAARLWICLGWYQQDQHDRLAQTFPEILTSCQEHGYDFLFSFPTLLGPPDERLLVPLLILARDNGWETAYVSNILQAINLPLISIHPGYQLCVSTLGKFLVSRGSQEISPKGWSREKTRQLFQLLITFRYTPMEREQIYEHLWPGADPTVSQRNFKVILNTLFNVLEPQRKPGSDSAYVIRDGSTYRIRPGADLWLDVEEFINAIQAAEDLPSSQPDKAIIYFEKAISLYHGEYLPDTRYENWAAAEREHLAVLFLRAADRLCEIYVSDQRYEETIDLCYRILNQDNCWERAYRYLMIVYDHLGDRGQIARTYQRCQQTLQEELAVLPSDETEVLYQKFTAKIEK
jgi:ATP/maltotriose-dependent transcriptional regulator MalT/DNA-binding SARP family transcriptional activator